MSLNNIASISNARADAVLNAADAPKVGANAQAVIDAAYAQALAYGADMARGESAVTQLAFGFQKLVCEGALTEGHAENLYLRHAGGYNDFVRANPHLGKEEMAEDAKSLKSNISTLRSFARKGAREMGQDGLYDRVRLMRVAIGRDNWAQKSAFNAFVKVNREVYGLCAKCLSPAAFPQVTDEMLALWLTKEVKATDDLVRAIDALRKAVEARPSDEALNEVFALVERYGAIAAVEPAKIDKVVATTNFAWTAPIVHQNLA